jgi:thiosulfate dehydrogenase
VDKGNQIFHSVKMLGGTIGVSCDMSHPDAATHVRRPIRNFRSKLQRVAQLRDMINRCIENPVKGKMLSPDDPKMRALVAYYVIAQRNASL